MGDVAVRIAETVRPVVEENTPTGRVAVLLSGGVDSTSVLLAAISRGADPVAYSFRLAGLPPSADFRKARETAVRLRVPFVPVVLPSDTASLVADVRHLTKRWRVVRKPDVECSWPRLHALRKISGDGIATLITGDGADGYYALSRKACVAAAAGEADNPTWLAAFTAAYFARPDPAQMNTLRRMAAAEFGVDVAYPWHDQRIVDAFGGATWDDVNRPRQKNPTRLGWDRIDRLRIPNHSILQGGDSGISRHFENLLRTSLNVGRWKVPGPIYKRLYDGSIS